jgi:hypothetical protein
VTQLVIDTNGTARCVYAEDIDLASIGSIEIPRASHVEPDVAGRWWAQLSPVGGPLLGPFQLRSEALQAEVRWLQGRGVLWPAR